MRRVAGLVSPFLPFLLVACKPKPSAETEAPPEHLPRPAQKSTKGGQRGPGSAPNDLAEAMAQMKNVLEGRGGSTEPVDFRELEAMLPERLDDLRRTKLEGQKSGAFGFKVSTAQGRYEKDHGRVDLKVTDIGAAQTFAGVTAAAWTGATIDRDWDDGYERTTTLNGPTASEKFTTKTMEGEVQLIVAGRFMVEAKGRRVKIDVLHNALGLLPLDALTRKQVVRAEPRE